MIRTHIEAALGHSISDEAYRTAISQGTYYLKSRYAAGIRVTMRTLLSTVVSDARITDKAYPAKEDARLRLHFKVPRYSRLADYRTQRG